MCMFVTRVYVCHNYPLHPYTLPNLTQDGYRTLIGEGSGRPLTQAQALRVSFARALVGFYEFDFFFFVAN